MRSNIHPVLLCLVLLSPAVVQITTAGCVVRDIVCYKDGVGPHPSPDPQAQRILGSTNQNHHSVLSNEYCAQICHDQHFALAGTESGGECFCGNALNVPYAQRVSPQECSAPCRGTPHERCGGDWRIAVFNVSCSGTRVPPPYEAPLMNNPCLNGTFAALPFCDPKLPIDVRVADAVKRMTLDEKINALGTNTHAIKSLGLSSYNWWSEATHGVESNGGRSFPTTNFAFPITTAMSFNRSLWRATGAQIGREARAAMNAGAGYSTFWAPVINLAREPRWARNIETPGEDPYLSGEYATAFVRGFQEAPEDPGHVMASACCKHYVANEMDGSTVDGVHWDRMHVDSAVPIQDLVDSYMPPFQACVEKGRVTGLMCSYNAVNGVPSCANPWLLETVARGEWGFDGYVTADCDADSDVYNSHHYTKTPEESVQKVLRAGTDVDCGGFVSKYAPSALAKGLITEADIITRLSVLFKIRMRLGHFDPEGPLQRIPKSVVCTDYSKGLANAGAAQGASLLKNVQATLPLDAAKAGTVAVIGPNANLSKTVAGYYGPGQLCGGNYWNLVDAVARHAARVTHAAGVPAVLSEDTSKIAEAVAVAQAADQVVLALGTDLTWAEEGRDAVSIAFTKAQLELASRVAAAAKRPVVAVLLTAVPLDISPLLANPKIGAVLHAGQPSVAVLGVGDVLFGRVSPAGRAIQTVYPATYANEVSIFDFAMRPGPSPFPRPDCAVRPASRCPNGTNPGRTHRFYTGAPIVPFGFGLSYATFRYAIAVAPPAAPVPLTAVRELLAAHQGRHFISHGHGVAGPVQYAVDVTNTGQVDADDAVLGFMVPPQAGTGGIPLQSLFGFERVHVKAGQTVRVWLYPALTEFMQVDDKGGRRVHAGEYTFRFGVAETLEHGQGYAEHTVLTV